MEYHLEHHMFPMVLSYNLKKLHNIVKDQLPKPFLSLFSFYKQILPIVIKQARDPSIYFKVNFPEKKYRH